MLASYLLDATRPVTRCEGSSLEHLGYKALTEEDVCGKRREGASPSRGCRRRRC